MKTKTFGNIVEESSTGLRMPEPMALHLATISKGLPTDFKYKRLSSNPADFEAGQLEDGSRTDISTITTDDPDHEGEVILSSGIDWGIFLKNPIVPFAHKYDELPVGRALWLKPTDDMHSTRAKTQYSKRPAAWQGTWMPDAIHSMMQDGVCRGKSIGFIPTNRRNATSEEVKTRPDWKGRIITDKAIGLEYSVAPIPMNPGAMAIAVSKCVSDPVVKRLILEAAGISMEGETNQDAMPSCPKCFKADDVVKKDDDGGMFMCMKCQQAFSQDESDAAMDENEKAVAAAAVKAIEDQNKADAETSRSKWIEDARAIVIPMMSIEDYQKAQADKKRQQILNAVTEALSEQFARAKGRA